MPLCKMKSTNLQPEHIARIKKLSAAAVGLAGIGAGYALLSRLGISVPCVFHKITGLYCPGCGISRMCLSLLRFDIAAAFHYNAAALIALPFFVFLAAVAICRYIKTGTVNFTGVPKMLVWMLLAFFLLFGALRNLPALWFLAPA